MNLESRIIEFVQEFLKLQNEELVFYFENACSLSKNQAIQI